MYLWSSDSIIFVFVGSVLLEGLFCWGCGENGSSKTGKVSEVLFRIVSVSRNNGRTVVVTCFGEMVCLFLGFTNN